MGSFYVASKRIFYVQRRSTCYNFYQIVQFSPAVVSSSRVLLFQRGLHFRLGFTSFNIGKLYFSMAQSVLRSPDVIDSLVDFFCFSSLCSETILDKGMCGDIVLASLWGQPDKKSIVKRFTLLNEETRERNMDMFNLEVKFMQSLDHPFIAKCIYATSCPTDLCITMKYYSGGSLEEYLGYMILDMTELYAIQVACALRYLHNHNLVHLDVKLDNIFIDEECNAILGDFGLAKELEPEQKSLAKRNIGGTHGYFAPEYIKAKPDVELDPYKMDAYSLGVVIWCLVFEQGSDESINYYSETKKRRDLQPNIRDMLLRLLQRNPAKRVTVGDFLRRVRRHSIYRHVIDKN